MRNLIAFPLLLLAAILQSSVVSQIRLLSGFADLTMLILAAWALQERVQSAWHWAALAFLLTGFLSHFPWFALGYFAVVWLARTLQKRVWQAPLLAMFSVTFAGTLLIHLASFSMLAVLGTPLPFGDAVSLATLPSLLLNMILSIPVYGMMRDLARWVYPPEEYE